MRQVTRSRDKPGLEDVDSFCTRTRVRVQAYAADRLPDCLDNNGRSLFCVWKLPCADSKADGLVIQTGYAPKPKRTALFEVWADPGSVLLRAGGTLSLAGGHGEFQVQLDSAKEVWFEPETFWLTSWFAEARTIPEWPPNATVFRLLQGSATFGAATAEPLVEYPIAAIGAATTVSVQGHWQAGTRL